MSSNNNIPFAITYAQNREDIVLSTLLKGIKRGFYVDVGANDPNVDSVTKYFYKQGWKGINIEPIHHYLKQFKKERKRDINLEFGVGSSEQTLRLRKYKNIEGHSTFSESVKNQHSDNLDYEEYDVPVLPLKKIFKEYLPAGTDIDFLKIDVEGFEFEVLKGNDWNKYIPKVLCIEANHIERDWHPLIASLGYCRIFDDGLNEYYLTKEMFKNFDADAFLEELIIKSQNSITWNQFVALKSRDLRLEELDAVIKKQHRDLNMYKRLSLYNKPFLTRLKIVVWGLTMDWVSYKKK